MRSYSTLPDEIMIDIISRLPARTVGRCRCVCKSWRLLLFHPEFIRNHLNRTKNLLKQAMIFNSFNNHALYYAPLETAHQVFDEITISAKRLIFADYPDSWTQVWGSCDGLLLVEGKMGNTLVMNPTTREVGEVPRSPFGLDPSHNHTMYVLGHDLVGGNYKVVSLSFDIKAEVDCTETFVNIYSLETGIWKNVNSPLYWHCCTPMAPGVFMEGCVHWVACIDPESDPTIIAFDLAEETFCQVPSPSLVGDMSLFNQLAVLGGYLCTFNARQTSIWVMKEYGLEESWTKFTIADLGSFQFKALCMLGQEELVLANDYEELVICNVKEGTLKDLVVDGVPDDRLAKSCFVESLISPSSVMKLTEKQAGE